MLYTSFSPSAPGRWGFLSRSKRVADVALTTDGTVSVSTTNATPEELAAIQAFIEQKHG